MRQVWQPPDTYLLGCSNYHTADRLTDANGKPTDYHSGQEFHVDLAAGYNFAPLTAPVSAYYYKQTSDDKINGVRVGPDSFRGEAFVI